MYKKLIKNIKFIVIRASLYYDKIKLKELNLKEEDSVYLVRKNIKIKRLNTKLDYTKLKSFKIKRILKQLIYKFELSNYIRIHSVFHISILESASRNTKYTHVYLNNKT